MAKETITEEELAAATPPAPEPTTATKPASKTKSKAKPVVDPADPFAAVSPLSKGQIEQGSIKVLELSHDQGETWFQFPVERFHFFAHALEADMERPSPLTIDSDVKFLARIIKGGETSVRIWEGKTKQSKIRDGLYRLRIYKEAST